MLSSSNTKTCLGNTNTGQLILGMCGGRGTDAPEQPRKQAGLQHVPGGHLPAPPPAPRARGGRVAPGPGSCRSRSRHSEARDSVWWLVERLSPHPPSVKQEARSPQFNVFYLYKSNRHLTNLLSYSIPELSYYQDNLPPNTHSSSHSLA